MDHINLIPFAVGVHVPGSVLNACPTELVHWGLSKVWFGTVIMVRFRAQSLDRPFLFTPLCSISVSRETANGRPQPRPLSGLVCLELHALPLRRS